MTGVPFVVDPFLQSTSPLSSDQPGSARDGAGPGPGASLRLRVPGQALMEQVLELVELAEPGRRGGLARLLGRSPLPEASRSWFSGVLGEQRVGRVLGRLPAPWVVLHSVPIGAGSTDVDHVVLGPPGVFTVNSKHHPGQRVWVAGRTVLVAGHKHPYIPKAESEGKAAAKLLAVAARSAVPVRPVIAVVGAKQLTVRQAPERVQVTTDRRLRRWLLAQPPVLSPEQVGALAALAERPGLWHTAPALGDPAAVLEQRFGLLHREVRAARRVRTAWAGGIGLAGVATLGAVGPDLAGALAEAVVQGYLPPALEPPD